MTQSSLPPRLRIAFVGGAINSAVGRVHRVATGMDQRFELVTGCFSRHAEINEQTARDYAISGAGPYATLEALLEAEARHLDAIVVLTPSDQHKAQVLSCLDAGVPVICEKALVGSSADAREIKAHLGKTGYLTVTYNYTGYPMLRELKNLVDTGFLGPLEQITVEMPQEGFARITNKDEPVVPQEWRLHDGQVPTVSLDLGVHLHAIVRFLTGQQPRQVVAMSNTFGNFHQIIDNVSCLARYSDGLACSMWYGKTALGHRNGLRVRLYGKLAGAEWYQEAPEVLNIADNHGRRYTLDRASPDIAVANAPRYTRFKAGHPAGFIEAFANYYNDIAEALTLHKEGAKTIDNPYVFGIDDALEGITMLEAISRSSARNAWEDVQ